MSVSDLTFADIDPELIDQAEEYMRQVLQEAAPSLDLSEGRVIRQLVVNTAAILHAVNRQDIENLVNSFSPVVIAADPDAADPDITDAVYGNYGIERFDGNKATGQISIIISALTTTAVPTSTVFTANGLNYVTSQPYVGVTAQESVVSSGERLIQERSDGTFFFTVPVTAEFVGETYRAQRGTRFTVSPAIGGMIDAQAAADFEGGLSAETNAELAARAQEGIAPKVFSGRAQIDALIADEFTEVKATSQVGFGDPEMLRDRHNIFGWSQGGKADLYVKTADVPAEIKLTKSCEYLGDNAWRVILTRNDAPGFYLVTAIVPFGEDPLIGGLDVAFETRGLDLTAETDFVQQLEGGMVEGAYSRYQTAVVQFEDTSTPAETPVGATANYDVYVLRAPDIRGINDLTVDRSRRPPTGDYLPRAPVPALAAVSLKVSYRTSAGTVDTDAVKQAIFSRVNGLGFNTGRLPLSVITDAAHGAIELGGSYVITPLDLHAFIYPPDTVPLGRIELRDPDVLTIPNLPSRGVSQRTTCFYMLLDSISVTAEAMAVLSI